MNVEDTVSQYGAVAAFVVATAPGVDDAVRDLLWRPLAGKPAVAWALAPLRQFGLLGYCGFVAAPDYDEDVCRMLVHEAPARMSGILSSADATWRGALANAEKIPATSAWIIVLDAALPLITPDSLRAGVRAAAKTGVSVAAEPVKETLKRVHGHTVTETPPRDTLRRLLTPIVFRRDALQQTLAALNSASYDDDLFALVQLSGVPLTVFDAGYPGLRATHVDDLPIIETLLRQRQTEIEKA